MNLDEFLSTAGPAIHALAQVWPSALLLISVLLLCAAGLWYSHVREQRDQFLLYLRELILMTGESAPSMEIIADWSPAELNAVERYCNAVLYGISEPERPECLVRAAFSRPSPRPAFGEMLSLIVADEAIPSSDQPWPPNKARCFEMHRPTGCRCRLPEGHASKHFTLDGDSWDSLSR